MKKLLFASLLCIACSFSYSQNQVFLATQVFKSGAFPPTQDTWIEIDTKEISKVYVQSEGISLLGVKDEVIFYRYELMDKKDLSFQCEDCYCYTWTTGEFLSDDFAMVQFYFVPVSTKKDFLDQLWITNSKGSTIYYFEEK